MATVQEIYNEIDRIDNAKSGIAGAIEEKGVEVPAGAKIDEYPGLVRQIQQGDISDCVKFTPQTLTEEQKAQARENIGAGSGGGDGKIGVISQTQTWTQAADGGWDYTMNNLVRGLIPKANIDLFESAGAMFNETSGYFELNGLTDISYEEMQAVYFNSVAKERLINYEQAFAGKPIRTNLTLFSDTATAFGSVPASQINCRGIATSSMIEVFNWSNNESPTSFITKYRVISSMDFGFRTPNGMLKKIIGVMNCQALSSISGVTFQFQNSLEDIKLFGIKGNISISDSRRLTVASVAFMVENAINTSAITITLHATSYARCQADTTQYTYQGNTYTGVIAYANARNITIASA